MYINKGKLRYNLIIYIIEKYIIYYNVFHSSFRVPKYIVASLFGPLEMAMAAVLPGETNHSEVEANLLMGVLREERRDSKRLG